MHCIDMMAFVTVTVRFDGLIANSKLRSNRYICPVAVTALPPSPHCVPGANCHNGVTSCPRTIVIGHKLPVVIIFPRGHLIII